MLITRNELLHTVHEYNLYRCYWLTLLQAALRDKLRRTMIPLCVSPESSSLQTETTEGQILFTYLI